MSLFDVCRLCSSKNNLVWVFNMENETDENMEKVIFVTTGIEIHKKDMVSQKICDKCTQFTIAMSSFRKKCLENDKRLKDTCMQILKDNDMKIPNTEVTIKHDKGTVKDKPKQVQSKCLPKVHATVADLFKTYPGLKLPTPCLNKDVAPFVSMPLDQVEQYFENRRLNFNEHVRYCFRSKKADDKESANFSSGARPAKPNFVINAAIISNEEDEDNGVVRPIKIKIFSKDKFYNNSDKNHNISLNKYSANKVCDKPPATNRPKVPEHTRFYRKRHFPPVKDSLDTENDKHTPAPLSFIEKSFPLHICDICNSVHYNAKDLKKHQFKHLQCQFCKMKFINSESKLEHLENKCIIKSTMENLPSIEIEKIEYNLKIRKQYPEAFTDFPALERETNVTNNCNAKNLESVKVATSISPLKKDRYKHVTAEDTVEIIDISSDDDDDDDDVVPIMESNSTNADASSTVLGHSTNQKSKDESQSVAGVVSKNVPADSNTIIKPNIKVRDSSVLKGVGPNMSDKDVLQKLLISVPLKSYAEISTQTYSPKNHAIRLNSHELSAELNNLKAMLHSYIIPVVIKRGNFSVSYDYSKNSRGPKRLHLWNDLQPADVKVKKRRLSTHLSPVETTSEKSKTNSVHSIPISEPSGMENNVSTSLQRAQHKSSSVGDAATFHQAVTTSSSPLPTNQCPSTAELQTEINVPSPSASTSSKSNISALQQVYSSHSKSQSTTRIPNSSSSGIVILQHIYQSSSSAQPQEIVAAPIPASRCTSPSETNISASQQALVTSTPVSSYANSCVSNTSVPHQPDNYQYSSSSKLPAIDVTPSPAPSCTNSSASNMIIPVQTVSQRPSIPQLQEVASTCTNSSVTDVFATQTNASQYFSASEPQATPASASTYKNSSVSNITAPQQAACHYSSISPSQNSAAPIIASTCTGSLTHISASEQDFPILCSKSLSNITVSQQAACQFSSTSNTQTIISVPSSALSSTSNAVIPQQTVCQYSSIPSSQVITAPISSSTCTSSFVTDISVSQNDVYQYSSNSVDVATPNPVSSYNNSYGSNITAPLPSDYQYPLTSEPQAVISKSSSALLCTNWAVTNTIVQQQTVIDLSTSHHYSSDFHTREVFTMPGPTLSGTSVSEANMSVSRPFGYQYSSASNYKEIKSASVLSSSMCTSTSAENLFGSQQDSPISKPQRVTADDVPASTCVSTSSSNISAPLQDVYQCTSTSKPQEGSAPPNPPIASPTTPLALNISAPQSFIRIKDMSELT